MQIKGLLPIGSVVSLNNLEQVKVMITGFCVRKAGEEESLFDYSGCVHPVGIIRPDQMILFNHSSIDKIHYMGYLDEFTLETLSKMEELLITIRNSKPEDAEEGNSKAGDIQ